jgi:ferredoxin/flavodoxin
MTTQLFYYTGTGNSLWVARKLSEQIENCTLHFIPKTTSETLENMKLEQVGFVFPVYIWGVPKPVLDFINSLKEFSPRYCFAVATNGGQLGYTLMQLKKILLAKNVKINCGFGVKMPSNYIPWGGPGTKEAQQKLFTKAEQKIKKISEILGNQENRLVEKGSLFQCTILRLMYKLSAGHVNQMDSSFHVDNNCNGCKICQQICPANNITMNLDKPEWLHRCHQCFACLQWCPQEAIQYGKRTQKYARYQHPEIKLKTMLTH